MTFVKDWSLTLVFQTEIKLQLKGYDLYEKDVIENVLEKDDLIKYFPLKVETNLV